MKDVFEPSVLGELTGRINKLRPDSQRQWGKMNVGQMLAHCSNVLEVATGDRKEKPSLVSRLLGPFIKGVITSEKPFKRNLPTGPGFIVADEKEFDVERQRLIELLTRFSKSGPETAGNNRHPLLGKFSAGEWSRSTYKHLDHHLQQFGV